MAAIIKSSENEWVWVRWLSLSQSFVENGWIQDGKIQDGYHHQINQIELVWVRVGVEWECFRVNLRKDNKVSESKMAVSESKMAEFKMADIIKLSENEWVWVRLNYFESELEWSESVFEWISEKITRCLNPRWQCLNLTWQNSRWLSWSSWVRMNEWSFFCANNMEPILASVSEFERKY